MDRNEENAQRCSNAMASLMITAIGNVVNDNVEHITSLQLSYTSLTNILPKQFQAN